MVNLPLTKVIGLPITDFIPDTSKPIFKKIIEKGWQSDSKGEIYLKNKNNQLIPFLLSVTSLELDEGAALSIILTDLSLQKENEKQLQLKNEELQEARLKAVRMNEELEDMVKARTKDLFLSREYFKFLANNVPVIIWTADAEGKLDYVNSRWHEYTGFNVEESQTKQQELIHPDDLESSSVAWKCAIKNKQKYAQEFRFKRRSDGVYRWHYAEAIPFKDEQGNVTAWLGTNIDIDDQKKELEKKDEFIGIASHELKTPLTSLKGYIQLIESQKDLSANVGLYAEKANSSIIKLQHLINDLLDVSKIKAGKLKFDVVTFDLFQLINSCVDNCKFIYPSHKIETELEENVMITGNEERLEQVLMNLINNAVKYSAENKEIIVRLEKNDTNATVSVIDFGIGMSASEQTKIFDRFYRVEDRSFHTSGLGMGLYIASEIIKEHNGEITVQSKLNKGSVFSFIIPLAL
jgi:two-component system CheB/CheR fusion protein